MLLACFGVEGKPGERGRRRENGDLERSECLVIAQVSSVYPKAPERLGGLRGASSLLPPPRSLATSHSPAVPGIALTRSVCPCPQCGSETERGAGVPWLSGYPVLVPRACGGSDHPLPFPSPCAAEPLDAAVLLPCAAAAAAPAARSLVERVSGCKLRQTSLHPPSREGYLVSTSRSLPPPWAPRRCRLQRDSQALPTPFLCQCIGAP